MKIDINKIYLDPKDFYSVLDLEGNLKDQNYKSQAKPDLLIKAYESMVLSRQQDTYMTQLQRQGRMLTFVPNFGEEALQVAAVMNLAKEDWFVPAFRANAAMLYRGVPLISQFYYWNGNEKGSKIPEGVNVLPFNIPIATQYSHAAGIAYGMKYLKKKDLVVTFIGDGGTAEGEFYEAINISSIHKLPVVFCINNNQWAISTPSRLESGSKTLAAKAVAAGIPAVRVDGNDLLASYEVMQAASEYVKSGKGPILIEFISWRQGPHTTSDNPRIYRTEEEEKIQFKNEPFHRIEKYLQDHKILSAEQIKKMWAEKLAIVKQAYQDSLKTIDVSVDEIFDYTYEKITPELAEQKAELKNTLAKMGGK